MIDHCRRRAASQRLGSRVRQCGVGRHGGADNAARLVIDIARGGLGHDAVCGTCRHGRRRQARAQHDQHEEQRQQAAPSRAMS